MSCLSVSALSIMSLPSVQTAFKFTSWIPKIMAQFCYLRLYFDINNVSRRLLQWIGRIENGLKRRPTTRYRTYSNQISTRLRFRSDNESAEEGDSWSSLWQDMHDHVGEISTRSWLVRLDLFWLYDLYCHLLINCTSGRVHVNLYLDFSRAYPQKWWTCWKKENSGYEGIIRGTQWGDSSKPLKHSIFKRILVLKR